MNHNPSLTLVLAAFALGCAAGVNAQPAVADSARSGTLTRAQAARTGRGLLVQEFDRIDTRRSGQVSFDDIRHDLRRRAASR